MMAFRAHCVVTGQIGPKMISNWTLIGLIGFSLRETYTSIYVNLLRLNITKIVYDTNIYSIPDEGK